MFKKILIGLIIIIVSGSAYFGYTYLKNRQLPDFDIYKTVPVDAIMLIESQDILDKLDQIKNHNKIWEELVQLPSIEKIDADLKFLMKCSQQNEYFGDLVKYNKLIISAHKIGKENLELLYLIKLNNFRDKRAIVQFVTSILPAGVKLTSRTYNNSEIYKVDTESKDYLFSFSKGVLIISSSAILVENAIRQAETTESILNDPGFVKVQKTSGKNVDANIYIHLLHFNDVFSHIITQNYGHVVSGFSPLGNWAELDVKVKDDALLLNGFTYSNESLNNYLNIFQNQEPVDHKINEVLPANTSVFVLFGISNTDRYLQDYKNYLEKDGKINQYQLQIDQYKNKYAIDLEDLFKNQLNSEIGVIVTDVPSASLNDNVFIVMRTQSKSIAESELEQVIEKIADTDYKKKQDYINEITIDKETKFMVYTLPVKNMYRTFFGKIFPEFDNQYITFIDNFIIVGNSKNSISEFIHSNILHKTLDNDMKFEQFSDYLSSKSNFYFYTNVFRSTNYISKFLNSNLKKGLEDHAESFKKFQALAVQFQQNNDMIYNNLYLQYIPDIKEDAVTVWESHLDTIANFKPCLVTNHNTKENEIFIQDLNNKIYLINKVGRILWKLQLNEKINSEVYQIDYYKNGKLQYLFSTENKIHLIDRNGNYVERYPVELRSASTAGLALFDYDNNMDYRIFIPCRNKNVYVYNIEGNLINGWEFKQTDTHVNRSVQHFRVSTNDYILFADQFRVYILNRRGEERIVVKNQFSKSKNNFFSLETGNSSVDPRFVTTDTAGMVKMIYLDGRVETKVIHRFSSNHYFNFEDVDADGFKDFIFLDQNKLEVYKENGTKIFDYQFKSTIDSAPIYYYFSYDDRKIGLVSKTTNEIFLFNSDGTLYNGFPLKGNTPFTIGYLGNSQNQFNLIVGTQYNFLYNYSVN